MIHLFLSGLMLVVSKVTMLQMQNSALKSGKSINYVLFDTVIPNLNSDSSFQKIRWELAEL